MSSRPSEICVVLMTAPSADVAASIGRTLVEERLAACANIVPNVRSIYRWQGAICDDSEVLCIIKTRPALFDALRDRIAQLHPYEVPEIVAIDPAAVSEPYERWVVDCTREHEA
jgi:periplasmic divalent cation tolerance protein